MSAIEAAQRPVFAWNGLGGIPDDIQKGEWFEAPGGKLYKAYDDMPAGWVPWLAPNDIGAFKEFNDARLLRSLHEANMGIVANTSGIHPTEYKVLILPKPVEEKTAGGIIVPDAVKEKEEYATTKGTVIAVSPFAFSYVEEEKWLAAQAVKPKPGDTVLYARYAGTRPKGKDGKEYVLLEDRDICATIEE